MIGITTKVSLFKKKKKANDRRYSDMGNDVWQTTTHRMKCNRVSHAHRPLVARPSPAPLNLLKGCDPQDECHRVVPPSFCPCRSFCLAAFPHNLLVNLDQSHRVFKTLVNVTAYGGYSLAQLLKDFNVCAFLGHFSWVADRRAFPLRLTNPRRPEESLISAFGSEAQLAGDEWKGF